MDDLLIIGPTNQVNVLLQELKDRFEVRVNKNLKDFVGALADINAALMLLPNLPAALLERGIIFNLVGQAENAATDWKKIIEVAPNSAEAHSAKEWIDQIKIK